MLLWLLLESDRLLKCDIWKGESVKVSITGIGYLKCDFAGIEKGEYVIVNITMIDYMKCDIAGPEKGESKLRLVLKG